MLYIRAHVRIDAYITAFVQLNARVPQNGGVGRLAYGNEKRVGFQFGYIARQRVF
jgi:hypothetical protein